MDIGVNKIEGIILAAGYSARVKAFKMTLPLGEKTVLESCLQGMLDFCDKIIVIGGYQVEKIIPIVKAYPKVELVYNENYSEGMFSSVKKGLSYITSKRFFLTPGDYPVISKDTYRVMLNTVGEIVVPVYDGQTGHPALLASYLSQEIGQKEASLKEFINTKGFTTVTVDDEGILLDIDTWEDYLRIKDYLRVHNSGRKG